VVPRKGLVGSPFRGRSQRLRREDRSGRRGTPHLAPGGRARTVKLRLARSEVVQVHQGAREYGNRGRIRKPGKQTAQMVLLIHSTGAANPGNR